MSGHGLGPHVVGQRVVIRRIVPGQTGPTGGPAFTDLLGVCERWSDGEAAVRDAGGELVVIPTALIVSGKPVPPRPPTRHRLSARDAESHAAVLWTGVDREALGAWELRSVPRPVGRLLKRANSCLAMGDPGVDLAIAADRVLDWYAARDRPALVQVETGSRAEDWFTAAGWDPVSGDAQFWLGSVSRALRALAERAEAGALSSDGPRLEVVSGTGRVKGGLDGDWLGLHDLYVDPEHRGHGQGAALVRTLLEAGAERGALHLWLHVELPNPPAVALYAALGMAPHHDCRYLAAPRAD